jgi:hypothetical protein
MPDYSPTKNPVSDATWPNTAALIEGRAPVALGWLGTQVDGGNGSGHLSHRNAHEKHDAIRDRIDRGCCRSVRFPVLPPRLARSAAGASRNHATSRSKPVVARPGFDPAAVGPLDIRWAEKGGTSQPWTVRAWRVLGSLPFWEDAHAPRPATDVRPCCRPLYHSCTGRSTSEESPQWCLLLALATSAGPHPPLPYGHPLPLPTWEREGMVSHPPVWLAARHRASHG